MKLFILSLQFVILTAGKGEWSVGQVFPMIQMPVEQSTLAVKFIETPYECSYRYFNVLGQEIEKTKLIPGIYIVKKTNVYGQIKTYKIIKN